ncbi:MAG: hypothetical protein ACRD3S_22420, partial [Terracidiphilus sp.]
ASGAFRALGGFGRGRRSKTRDKSASRMAFRSLARQTNRQQMQHESLAGWVGPAAHRQIQ